jgi:hypothetical protein|tara:strand:+ start:1585 stop:1758 length:174 start_codon:yes stop_codon:yes gene_type:complete
MKNEEKLKKIFNKIIKLEKDLKARQNNEEFKETARIIQNEINKLKRLENELMFSHYR